MAVGESPAPFVAFRVVEIWQSSFVMCGSEFEVFGRSDIFGEGIRTTSEKKNRHDRSDQCLRGLLVLTAEPSAALRGLRVLDIGTMIAGPLIGSLLADFGADVIKVEEPTLGDPMRTWYPMKNGVSLWWKIIGRNKRLITLNLRHARGQTLLKEFVKQYDIVIENFRPGTLERWGLGFEDLRAVNPRVILVRVSGYGQTGPYRERPGYGTIAEAMTGVPSFTGFPQAPPTLSAWPLADVVAGLFGIFALMFAVYHRDVGGSGRGQVVDVSLYEPLFRVVESQVIGYDQLGIVKRRNGNRLDEEVPRNAYETKDGEFVTVSASSNRTFSRLAGAIGRPDLPADRRFVDNTNRVQHGDILDGLIANWFLSRSLREVMEVLNAHDVVAGPVYDIRRIFEDPQYRARENIVAVPDPDLGTIRMQGVVPKLSETPGSVQHAGLRLGAHNLEVYRERLNLDERVLAELHASGVV